MEWLDEFPTMERQGLRDLKKAIDLGFRDFSRAYGDGIEGLSLIHISEPRDKRQSRMPSSA